MEQKKKLPTYTAEFRKRFVMSNNLRGLGTTPLRSMLFVPANNKKYIEKAKLSSADVIILDLEDAIPEGGKTKARANVPMFAKTLKDAGHRVVVRINRPIDQAVLDINTAVCEHVDAFMLPKVRNVTHLEILEECVASLENARGLKNQLLFLPLIETPEAVRNISQIAAHNRVAAMAFGDEDLSAELGCDPSSDTLTSLKSLLVVATAGTQCTPLGLVGTISEIRDLSKFKTYAENAYALGLKGALCIHPDQVDVLNAVFKPSPNQVDHARKVIKRFYESQSRGEAVAQLEGQMIDLPVVRRAQAILELSEL